MKSLFFSVLLLASFFASAQSVDGALKTLTASGTDTYAITEPLPAAYSPKERFLVRFTNANTGAATLNRFTLGAKDIKKAGGTALSAGDIQAGGTYLLSYNGTYYQLVGDGGSGGGGGISESSNPNWTGYHNWINPLGFNFSGSSSPIFVSNFSGGTQGGSAQISINENGAGGSSINIETSVDDGFGGYFIPPVFAAKFSLSDNYLYAPLYIGGNTTPTAKLHLAAGSAGASSSPLKFTSGPLLSSPENGAMEYLSGSGFYLTTGGVRSAIMSDALVNAKLGGAVGGSMTGNSTINSNGFNFTINNSGSYPSLNYGSTTGFSLGTNTYMYSVTPFGAWQMGANTTYDWAVAGVQAAQLNSTNYVINKVLKLVDPTAPFNAVSLVVPELAADRNLSFPALTGNDTFVTEAHTQALTNKSVNGVTLTTGGGTTNFLRADGTYAAPSGGGDVSKTGTPANNQVAVWTADGIIEGTSNLTYDNANLQLTGDIGSTGTRITKGWFADIQVTNPIAGSITGNAATVTTNANLTGPVTSTGNATSISLNKAALDAAVSDGNIQYVGDAPTAHTLDSHSNVTITANSSGELLKWNGSAWINNTLAEAGIQPAGTYGDFVGPASAVDGEAVVFDGTTGKLGKRPTGTAKFPILGLAATTFGNNEILYSSGVGNTAASSSSLTWNGTTLNATQFNGVALTTGGGTTNFLRADGTYAAPAGGGTIVGSTGATDNRLIRADGTGGSTIQSSDITITDNSDIQLGGTTAGSSRAIQAQGSASDVGLTIDSKGNGQLALNSSGGSTLIAGISFVAAPTSTASEVQYSTGATNTVVEAMKVVSSSSGTAVAGFGTGLTLRSETGAANAEDGVKIESILIDATGASEDFDLSLKTMTAGSAATEKLRVKSTGQLQAPSYTTSSSFTGTPVGYLQFDASGNIITAAVGGGSGLTYAQVKAMKFK